MLYLLDADVLIFANSEYYPIDRIPQFWAWVEDKARQGLVKMTWENYKEVDGYKDSLSDWIIQERVKEVLLLSESVDPKILNHVIDSAYAPDLTDVESRAAGRDPFLIAYAMKDRRNRCVVTNEISKPKRKRGNRKIPDACDDLRVRWLKDTSFYKELDFRIP